MSVVVTAESRSRALLQLKHGHVSRLSPDQQLVLAVGLLIADVNGNVDPDELATAAADGDTCSIARELLRRALR